LVVLLFVFAENLATDLFGNATFLVTYGGNFVLGRPCTKRALRSLRASISWHFTFLKQFLKEVSCIALSKQQQQPFVFVVVFFQNQVTFK